MQWSDLSMNPSSRTLRQFALMGLVVLGSMAYWQEFVAGNRVPAILCGALGLGVGFIGWVKPLWLRLLFIGSLCLTFPLGWIVSQATLAILFYLIFTPLGLVFRLCGRDVLARQRRPDYDSYWQVKPQAEDVRAYFRQS